jgi:hypothetical protein
MGSGSRRICGKLRTPPFLLACQQCRRAKAAGQKKSTSRPTGKKEAVRRWRLSSVGSASKASLQRRTGSFFPRKRQHTRHADRLLAGAARFAHHPHGHTGMCVFVNHGWALRNENTEFSERMRSCQDRLGSNRPLEFPVPRFQIRDDKTGAETALGSSARVDCRASNVARPVCLGLQLQPPPT